MTGVRSQVETRIVNEVKKSKTREKQSPMFIWSHILNFQLKNFLENKNSLRLTDSKNIRIVNESFRQKR